MAPKFTIPISTGDWTRVASRSHIKVCESIHDAGTMNSGSEMTERQFILLRVIWKKPLLALAACQLWGDTALVEEKEKSSAESFLSQKLNCWSAFLDSLEYVQNFKPFTQAISVLTLSIRKRTPFDSPESLKEGMFALIRMYHQRIISEVSQTTEPIGKNDSSPRLTRARTEFLQQQQLQQQRQASVSPSARTRAAQSATFRSSAGPDAMAEQGVFESVDDDIDGDDENDEIDGDDENDENNENDENDENEGEHGDIYGKGAEDGEEGEEKEENDKKNFKSSIVPRTPKNRTVSAELPFRTAAERSEESEDSGLPDPDSPDTMTQDPAKDEQVVNSAFLALVQALAIHYPLGLNDVTAMQSYWTEHRFAFQVKTIKGEKIYESRVDGYLGPYKTGPPQVIIEVKPGCRSFKREEIRAQESGQVAAWIAEYPPTQDDEVGKYRSVKRMISYFPHPPLFSFFSLLPGNVAFPVPFRWPAGDGG